MNSMMTKEQVKELSKLAELFETDCRRVADVLRDFEAYRNPWEHNISNAEDFFPFPDEVYWKGWDRDNDLISGTFPIEYLSMTDDEIREAAEKYNAEYLEKKRLEKEDMERAETAAEYELYERLKEKFEGTKI